MIASGLNTDYIMILAQLPLESLIASIDAGVYLSEGRLPIPALSQYPITPINCERSELAQLPHFIE